MAPERFENNQFMKLLYGLDIKLVAFDEAHCISKWGHDFRPSYQQVIGKVMCLPQRFAVAALTATATAEVQQDIMERLHIAPNDMVKTSIKRPNLKFKVNSTYQRQKFVLEYVKEHADKAGIIYCSTRKQVEELQQVFEDQDINSAIYHAGLTNKEREAAQNDFVLIKLKSLLRRTHLEWESISLMFASSFTIICQVIWNLIIKKRGVLGVMD